MKKTRRPSPAEEEKAALRACIEQILGGRVRTATVPDGTAELVVEKPERVGNGVLVGLRVQGSELDCLRLAFRILDEQAA